MVINSACEYPSRSQANWDCSWILLSWYFFPESQRGLWLDINNKALLLSKRGVNGGRKVDVHHDALTNYRSATIFVHGCANGQSAAWLPSPENCITYWRQFSNTSYPGYQISGYCVFHWPFSKYWMVKHLDSIFRNLQDRGRKRPPEKLKWFQKHLTPANGKRRHAWPSQSVRLLIPPYC